MNYEVMNYEVMIYEVMNYKIDLKINCIIRVKCSFRLNVLHAAR